jgi:hypothetical protein
MVILAGASAISWPNAAPNYIVLEILPILPKGVLVQLPEYQPESDWRGMRVGEYDQTKHFPSSLWLRVEGYAATGCEG